MRRSGPRLRQNLRTTATAHVMLYPTWRWSDLSTELHGQVLAARLGPRDQMTLASCSTANNLQALSYYASCQHQTCSVIHDGVCHSNSCTWFQVTSPLCKQLSLWAAMYMLNVRRKCCRTALLEHPPHCTAGQSNTATFKRHLKTFYLNKLIIFNFSHGHPT